MRWLVFALIVVLAFACNGGGERPLTIVFLTTEQYGAIYEVRLDGSGLRRLRPGPLDGENPSLSPDGARIVFERDGDIFLAKLDGEDQGINLTKTSGRDELVPTWSPDGREVAFLTDAGAGNGTLEVMKADGSDRQTVAEGVTATSGMGSFAWSLDGKMLAFIAGDELQRSSVYVINTDGTGLTRLTDPSDGFHGGLTWSPDGKSIAFHVQATLVHATPVTMVMNADGSGLRRLVGGSPPGVNPVWSPNGKTILFYVGQSFRGSGAYCQDCLLVMDIDGPNPVIAARNVHYGDPSRGWQYLWSPDGRQIAFLKGETGIVQKGGLLHIVNTDHTGEKKLADLGVVSLLGIVGD
jgi:Tol biopolymer transport system component